MFKISKKSAQARTGVLTTAHGKLNTPFFMPVATRGALKLVSTEDVKKLGAQIILSNTYHLFLRPGEKHVKKLGGLHKFIDWPGAILTDSGGYQVFSLAKGRNKNGENLVKLSEQGVEFKSYLNGSRHKLTPESVIDIQHQLGVDISVCLDECVALPASVEYIRESIELTTRWAARAKAHHNKIKGAKSLLFAVVQGGLDRQLRLKSLGDLAALDFDGYNIGGLSVGESPAEMYKVLDYLMPAMPTNKPRYLMGVGYPENIVAAVHRGVDMFDCVIPTREGRHGRLFSWVAGSDAKLAKALASGKGQDNFYTIHNLANQKFVSDKTAINSNSKLPELRNYSRAYLHYLFKIDEALAQRLTTLNNLEFYLDLMAKLRQIIKTNSAN
ncbi:MAG TPA: tRNA guanosine(34) transglycosylase Tgt [bacterium]|nr:tRNA guanosine(34) transglycosylase Tgt [bacterium]